MLVTLDRSEWKRVYRTFSGREAWETTMAEIVSSGQGTEAAEFCVDVEHAQALQIGMLLKNERITLIAEAIEMDRKGRLFGKVN